MNGTRAENNGGLGCPPATASRAATTLSKAAAVSVAPSAVLGAHITFDWLLFVLTTGLAKIGTAAAPELACRCLSASDIVARRQRRHRKAREVEADRISPR